MTEVRKASRELRKEEGQVLENNKEITNMIKCYEVQRNVNMTVNDRLKNLQSFIKESK